MIKGTFDFDITENAKELLISKLTDELIFLRTKLGLSQDELSNLIGISRQTYSTLETKKRTMSWGTYLSLILIFDNNEQTHDIIRDTGIFPYMLFGTSEAALKEKKTADLSSLLMDDVRDKLDDLLKSGVSPQDVYQEMLKCFEEVLSTDEESLFWFALAASS